MTDSAEAEANRTVVKITTAIFDIYRNADLSFVDAMREAGESNVNTWIGLIAIHKTFSDVYQKQFDDAVEAARLKGGTQLETIEPQGHA
jgi:hypothetical protein